MPNQIDPDRRRVIFICDKEDFKTLEEYAERIGFTASIMLREAVFRLAEELRKNKRIVLLQQPKDGEGTPKNRKK